MRFVDLPELLTQSDNVSLRTPLTGETRLLIDSERLYPSDSGRLVDDLRA